MAWTDKLMAFLRRESADVKEELGNLRDKADAELSRREREMAATPTERMGMIEDEIDSSDPFDRIRDKYGLEGDRDGAGRGADPIDDDGPDASSVAEADNAAAAGGSGDGASASVVDDEVSPGREATTVDQALSDATSAARAGIDDGSDAVSGEPEKTVQEQAEDTLDELRAELGLPTDDGPDIPD